jgi:hypothetical protein
MPRSAAWIPLSGIEFFNATRWLGGRVMPG